ncbi:hypothetical protein [Frankia gtarii]|uniref:hypothetical protein n=1 Tax=Frankia gtarii TaxID=2950102 RepID=UPI0021BEBB8A|nr:hypothetical protein [Frankia gtarii]
MLAAVTGVQVDFHAAASPAGGWFTFGAAGWWTFAPFGTPVLTVGLNTQAMADWASATGAVTDIADELAAGTLGLMDVRRLWDAEQTARLHTDHVSAAAGDARTAGMLFGADEPTTNGNAADMIAGTVKGFASSVDGYHTALANSPSIADSLHNAGMALASFGRDLAKAYQDSALGNMPVDCVNSLSANLQNYFATHPMTSQNMAQVLAAYSTQAGGGLLAGMTDFGGDLTQPAVWNSASSAISTAINSGIEELDARAASLATTLGKAYQTTIDRLNAGLAGVARTRVMESRKPVEGEQPRARDSIPQQGEAGQLNRRAGHPLTAGLAGNGETERAENLTKPLHVAGPAGNGESGRLARRRPAYSADPSLNPGESERLVRERPAYSADPSLNPGESERLVREEPAYSADPLLNPGESERLAQELPAFSAGVSDPVQPALPALELSGQPLEPFELEEPLHPLGGAQQLP